MGRIDCEKCDGEGTREVETVEGGWVSIECDACLGYGSFEVYGTLTREDDERLAARIAESEASAGQWEQFVCTHCDYYCDAWSGNDPHPCHRSGCDGIVMPAAALKLLARPALPWRRDGDKIVAVPKPGITVRYLDKDGHPVDAETIGALLDEVVASGASFHLEAQSDFDATEGQDAAWWMEIRMGNEVVHVNIGAAAPIWTRVDRWTESPKEPDHG